MTKPNFSSAEYPRIGQDGYWLTPSTEPEHDRHLRMLVIGKRYSLNVFIATLELAYEYTKSRNWEVARTLALWLDRAKDALQTMGENATVILEQDSDGYVRVAYNGPNLPSVR